MKKFWMVFIVLALIVAGAVEWGWAALDAPGPAAKDGKQTVVVVKGGVRAIAGSLEAAGVVKYPVLFQLVVRVHGKGGALKAGEYAIPSNATMRQIIDILVSGKSIVHKVTIAEGLTSQMAYDLVKAAPGLTGDAGKVPAEGSLLPETYLFERGQARQDLLAKMAKARKDLLDKEWEARAPDLQVKTKEEALVLASIVEKETGIPAERAHIAAVFMNRLRIGMRLQSDPTIIYGITKGYPIGRRILQSEITAATPYNTYVIAGLPPQPICNPGKDAIHAVLHPADSKDLYFVTDGKGGHVFAATIEEQTKNVIAWRKIHLKGEK